MWAGPYLHKVIASSYSRVLVFQFKFFSVLLKLYIQIPEDELTSKLLGFGSVEWCKGRGLNGIEGQRDGHHFVSTLLK